MPREVVRQTASAVTGRSGPEYRISVHGRTVRIHLAGLLDRAGVQRLLRRVNNVLVERNLIIVLDGTRLMHIDYRCVSMLVRWNRLLRGFGHRLVLSGWNTYLTAILAMEDTEGELEDGMRRIPAVRPAVGSLRHVRVS
jgi:ABC-type transporter Mla MlaB component